MRAAATLGGGRAEGRTSGTAAGTTAEGILSLGLEAWVAATSRLLLLEQDASVNAASEAISRYSESDRVAQGVSLRLVVDSLSTGLMGRTTLTLAPRNGLLLPNHSFSTGDIVGIAIARTGGGPPAALTGSRDAYDASAVVVSVLKSNLVVSIDDSTPGGSESARGGDPLTLGDAVRIDKLADDVSFRRISAALVDLREYRHGAAAKVLRVLFATGTDLCEGSSCAPEFSDGPQIVPEPGSAMPDASAMPPKRLSTWTPLNAGLNASQLRAVESALRASDLCMIHGPPGASRRGEWRPRTRPAMCCFLRHRHRQDDCRR